VNFTDRAGAAIERRHYRGREVARSLNQTMGADRQTGPDITAIRLNSTVAASPGQATLAGRGQCSWAAQRMKPGLAEVGIVPIAEADINQGGAAAARRAVA